MLKSTVNDKNRGDGLVTQVDGNKQVVTGEHELKRVHTPNRNFRLYNKRSVNVHLNRKSPQPHANKQTNKKEINTFR